MAITSIQDTMDRPQQGKAIYIPFSSSSTGNTSGAAAASGSLSLLLYFNNIGYTGYSVLQEFPIQAGLTDQLRILDSAITNNRAGQYFWVRSYRFGSLNFTTTSSEFTHDSATFPITRTILGQASQPLNLIPILLVTTATTTTPAQFTMNYVDQDGNSVTGTVNHTMPAAASAIGTVNLLPLELDDTAVRDVTDIAITVTAAAGAAEIWGLDLLSAVPISIASLVGTRNTLVKSAIMPSLTPGAATSGTANTKLLLLSTGFGNNAFAYGHLKAYRDN